MLFNSLEFAIFLPLVFVLYWAFFAEKIKSRNIFFIVVSYIFYGWWDWRFLFLIIISSFVDYYVGNKIVASKSKKSKSYFLMLSIFVNLGFLMFFKYFNFFIDNFHDAFSFFGMQFNKRTLNIVLPVGISFYTFQTMSYSIDVYREKLKPTKDIFSFFAYVSFFPQLVAGPIERAVNLLPQFYKPHKFNYSEAADGMRQILWGFFKKIVIADNAAVFVNDIFSNYTDYNGSTLLIGGFFFAFQIYGDFSGYSDIAIGTARLFGFKLMRNFAFPYFSRDIAEFWRRWHISLSSWFKDYLYIPLGGSRGTKAKIIRNTFIIFVVSGFWHGANWTFIAWGAINAMYFIPVSLRKKNRKNIDVVAKGKILPNIKEIFQIGFTFFITIIAWVFFRADSIKMAFDYLKRVFSKSLLSAPHIGYSFDIGQVVPIYMVFLLIFILVFVEWFQRDKQHGLEFSEKTKPIVRYAAYFIVLFLIVLFGNFSKTEFIYFAF
ncbi:MAG: MBOAT family protein [Bacteroidales bacterium]|nr:MBOAT family protein [Bacteroidales bacterium]